MTAPAQAARSKNAGPHDRYVTEFEAFAANGASAVPDWVARMRRSAIARFAEVGFPSTKAERWRFTSVDPLVKGSFEQPPKVAPEVSVESLEALLVGDPATRLVATFVNGSFAEHLSSLPKLPDGVRVGSLAQGLREDGDRIQEHLGRYAKPETSPFTALNTAFMRDGAYLYVGRDIQLDRPVQLVFIATVGDKPIVAHPRTLVIADQGARLSLIESYGSAGSGTYWSNPVTEIALGENAVVDHYRVQREDDQAYHTATSQSYQGRTSVYSINTFAFGSAISPHDLTAVLDGSGAECTLNGLTVLGGRQMVDHHTTIDHAQPHCNSWELFNGVYDDRARGVFTGRIIVRPGAQRTDSKQTNNNLLLSEDARADSQPQLEIYADDVKCTHGATLGPIDPIKMFYLRSRGLDAEQARNLLTYGFGAEVLNSVAIDELRERLDVILHARLDDATGRRRSS